MRTLLELQRALQTHVLSRGDEMDSGTLRTAGRLDIYRNGYRARLLESLSELYPKLHALLGGAVFADACGQFVQSCPSVHRSIRCYGRELSEFLAHTPPYDRQPVLAELAELEWAFAEVFDAADEVPINAEVLSAVAPERWGNMCFEFHPSMRKLMLRHGSMSIWQAISHGVECLPPSPAGSEGGFEPQGEFGSGTELQAGPGPASESGATWVLWRRDLKTHYRSQAPAETMALDTALQGRCFAQICTAITFLLPPDEVASCAARCLATWTDGGMITAVRFDCR